MTASDEILWDIDWSDLPVSAGALTQVVDDSEFIPSQPVTTLQTDPSRVSARALPAPPDVAPPPVISVPTMPVSETRSPPACAVAMDRPSEIRLVRGQRIDFTQMKLGAGSLALDFATQPLECDLVCIGLDGNGRAPSQPYLIYRGQKQSPCGGLALDTDPNGGQRLGLDVALLPPHIHRVVFGAFVGGAGNLGNETGILRISYHGETIARFDFSGADVGPTKGVILADVYLRQSIWRFFIRSEGFAGDLNAFAAHFGLSLPCSM
jgi:stress response protein SCP2